MIDAFSVPPRKGVQLLSGTLRDGFQNFNNFFRMRSNSNAIGGDYLCEAILFTNKLAEAEFAQVERYLMAKWSLPDASSGLVHLGADVGRVVVRGGMAPALSAGAGQTLDASYVLSTNVASPSAELQRSDGTALSISRGSGNAFVKTGGAEARVKAVGENVGAVRVEEGAFVLAAPESAAQFASGSPWVTGTGLDVSVQNAGFEADSSHWQNKSWRFRYADAASGEGGHNAYEGAYGMALRGKGAVTWTIAIPADGIYRLRFAAHERVDDRANSGRLPLRVTIAPEGGTDTDIATVTPFCSNFNEYSVLFRASARLRWSRTAPC